VLRGIVLVLAGSTLALPHDPDGYRALATQWSMPETSRSPDERPVAYRPPLYPLLLSFCATEANVTGAQVTGEAIAVLHFLLGVATIAGTWRLARLWGLSSGPAAVAATLVAVDPLLLHASGQVMTETLATACVVLALGSGTHAERSQRLALRFWAGLTLSLACLCRPVFVVWTLLLLATHAVSLVKPRSVHVLREGAALAALSLGAASLLGIWAVRNYLELGTPILTTTHGGYTLWLGNHPEFYDYVRHGGWDEPYRLAPAVQARIAAALPRKTELQREAVFSNWAWDAIRADPAGCAWASLYRLRRLWGCWPYSSTPESRLRTTLRVLVAVWYVLLWALVARGAWILRSTLFRAPWRAGLLLVFGLTLVHALFWTDLRMRAPAMPFLALVAAVGLTKARRENHDPRELAPGCG